ncbi:MAG: penicillin-binding protein 2 [Candidatus Omnitrophica bacterium]|nr:penicillin-binding protein 2 [Candidatus Omnitrophota bacterium]
MIRQKVLVTSLVLLSLLLVVILFNLQVLQGRKFRELSRKNCIRLIPQQGARGKILDRKKRVIAENRLSYNVMFLSQNTTDRNHDLERVAKIIGVDSKTIRDAYRRGFIASSVPAVVARNIDARKAIRLEELKSELPAVVIQFNPLRDYPYGKLACHLLGYLGEIDRWRLTKMADYGYKTKDIVGFGGVEEEYDYYLHQDEGGLSVEVDHRGRFKRTIGFQPPRNGIDIQLTLSLDIQQIVERSLDGHKGCVIIMEPHSGEIIAMASSPSFNPSIFIDRSPKQLSDIFNSPDAPLINRSISGAYPAGSLFKVVVAAAALETKKINSSTTFICDGKTVVGNKEFLCWDTHSLQDLLAAIAHSCNVFFYKTGLLLGAQTIHDYAIKFGFGRSTGLDLPYEINGFIPSPLWYKLNKFKKWYDGDTANMSIGQGYVLVTPIQIVRMMAVFANGGYLVRPYIVKAIGNKDISSSQQKAVYLNLKDTTIKYIRDGLRRVVSDSAGTGNVLAGLSIDVAGKTATAQAPPDKAHAWFSGFFPYQNPRFVICVFLEHGGPGYYACVVAQRIIEGMISGGLI